MAHRPQSIVPADVLLALSAALCLRGAVAEPASVAEVIERCGEAGRRSELRELIHHVDALPPAERRAFVEAIDHVQVASKLWLIDELTACLDEPAGLELLVLGAWYGILPLLLNLRLERAPVHMVCVDIDPHPCEIGEEVIGSMYRNVEYRCADLLDCDYESWGRRPAGVVVNTVCEHLSEPALASWWRRLPAGQLVVLQSNNYTACPDHVNCVRGLSEMKGQTPMSEVLFEGVLPLSLFYRFMLIGRR